MIPARGEVLPQFGERLILGHGGCSGRATLAAIVTGLRWRLRLIGRVADRLCPIDGVRARSLLLAAILGALGWRAACLVVLLRGLRGKDPRGQILGDVDRLDGLFHDTAGAIPPARVALPPSSNTSSPRLDRTG